MQWEPVVMEHKDVPQVPRLCRQVQYLVVEPTKARASASEVLVVWGIWGNLTLIII